MIQALLLAAAVILLGLAGLNVASPRFNPLGWGLACAVAGFGWPVLLALR